MNARDESFDPGYCWRCNRQHFGVCASKLPPPEVDFDALVDAGKVCPSCKRWEHITTERAMGMPLFVCACSCKWFDHVTMEAEA